MCKFCQSRQQAEDGSLLPCEICGNNSQVNQTEKPKPAKKSKKNKK